MSTYKITIRRTERNFYEDSNNEEWRYDGDDILFDCPDEPDFKLIEEIDYKYLKFKQLCNGLPNTIIKEEFRVDWATFTYYAKLSKWFPSHPNSCFSVDLHGNMPYHSFKVVSPTLNFFNNPFNNDGLSKNLESLKAVNTALRNNFNIES